MYKKEPNEILKEIKRITEMKNSLGLTRDWKVQKKELVNLYTDQ